MVRFGWEKAEKILKKMTLLWILLGVNKKNKKNKKSTIELNFQTVVSLLIEFLKIGVPMTFSFFVWSEAHLFNGQAKLPCPFN